MGGITKNSDQCKPPTVHRDSEKRCDPTHFQNHKCSNQSQGRRGVQLCFKLLKGGGGQQALLCLLIQQYWRHIADKTFRPCEIWVFVQEERITLVTLKFFGFFLPDLT